MRRLRALLAFLTMVATAMLPGPSHALAYAAHDTHAHAHHAADQAHRVSHADMSSSHKMAMHPVDVGSPGENHRGTHHEPCKSCSIACCAPITAALEAPAIAVAMVERRLRPVRPQADHDRADAAQPRPLRPPTLAA